LGPAVGLQLAGAGLAVAGAIEDRLQSVAFAYMVSSVAGVVAFFALRGSTAETVIAWATLASSAALVGALLLAVRVPLIQPPPWRVVSAAALALVRSVPLPASFVVMYPLSLALAPHDRPGQITLFGLAFTLCTYLAGATSQALSMSDAVVVSRLDPAAARERAAIVARAFRVSLLIAAAGLGVAAVAGAPIVRALLPADSSGPNSYFGLALVLLIPWMVATQGVWATLPVVLGRSRAVAGGGALAAVVALIAVHVIATLAGRALFGFDGVVLAMAAAPTVFVIVGLRIALPEYGVQILPPVLVVGAVAALSFGTLELVIQVVGQTGLAGGMVAALVGLLLYAGLAGLAYRDTARTLTRLVLRR
jgi:hypothetical protein